MNFWTEMTAHGTDADPHIYGNGPRARDWRECRTCGHWRVPVVESLTVHPADRPTLNQQIPGARVFGEPLPDGCLILEDPGVARGMILLCIEGTRVVATLGLPPQPRWIRCDPYGTPLGTALQR